MGAPFVKMAKLLPTVVTGESAPNKVTLANSLANSPIIITKPTYISKV